MRGSGIVPGPLRVSASQRVDIDGGGEEVDRDPMIGPVGVLLCGGGGGALVVGFGGDVGCGCVGTGVFDCGEDAADEDGCESLMAPPLGRSPEDVEPCASGSPLGRSVALEPSPEPLLELPPLPVVETAALLVSCPGGWLAVLLQAAQTRAATTAVAAALAGATVPRIGMDATVAK